MKDIVIIIFDIDIGTWNEKIAKHVENSNVMSRLSRYVNKYFVFVSRFSEIVISIIKKLPLCIVYGNVSINLISKLIGTRKLLGYVIITQIQALCLPVYVRWLKKTKLHFSVGKETRQTYSQISQASPKKGCRSPFQRAVGMFSNPIACNRVHSTNKTGKHDHDNLSIEKN